MSPTEFEDFVADLFGRMGFLVKVTPRTRDGGKDIILTQSSPFPMTIIVEWHGFRHTAYGFLHILLAFVDTVCQAFHKVRHPALIVC